MDMNGYVLEPFLVTHFPYVNEHLKIDDIIFVIIILFSIFQHLASFFSIKIMAINFKTVNCHCKLR